MRPHIQHSRRTYSSRELRDGSRYQLALALFIVAIGLAYFVWQHFAGP